VTQLDSSGTLTAKSIMVRKVISVGLEMTVREAAKLFHDNKISGAPVVDANGGLVGVISQTDMARHRVRGALSKDGSYWNPESAAGIIFGETERSSASIKVKEIMTKHVFSASESTPVRDIMRIMVKEKIHRVIITSDGKLCGVLSTMDVLRAVLHWLNRHAQDLED